MYHQGTAIGQQAVAMLHAPVPTRPAFYSQLLGRRCRRLAWRANHQSCSGPVTQAEAAIAAVDKHAAAAAKAIRDPALLTQLGNFLKTLDTVVQKEFASESGRREAERQRWC